MPDPTQVPIGNCEQFNHFLHSLGSQVASAHFPGREVLRGAQSLR